MAETGKWCRLALTWEDWQELEWNTLSHIPGAIGLQSWQAIDKQWKESQSIKYLEYFQVADIQFTVIVMYPKEMGLKALKPL